jgi:hypothetical protein
MQSKNQDINGLRLNAAEEWIAIFVRGAISDETAVPAGRCRDDIRSFLTVLWRTAGVCVILLSTMRASAGILLIASGRAPVRHTDGRIRTRLERFLAVA